MAEFVDAYAEVAEAAAKRRVQIREWAAKQVDPSLVVTETPDPHVVFPQQEVSDPYPADPIVVAEDQHTQVDPEVADPGPADVVAVEEEVNAQVDPDVEDPTPADPVTVEEDESEAPSKSANKGEWVAYRIKTNGLTEDQANEYTKDELIALK